MHEDLIKACTDDDDGTIDQDELDKWSAVLAANGIKTTKHWLTVKKSTSLEILIKIYGNALVGYLDELAGPPGACGALRARVIILPPCVWLCLAAARWVCTLLIVLPAA